MSDAMGHVAVEIHAGARLAGRQGRAFSLLEMVVVVAILGVLASMATMGFHRSIARTRLATAAERLASDLQWVRDQAVATRSPLTVTFDRAARSYTATGVASLDRGRNVGETLSRQQYGVEKMLLSTLQNEVTFDAAGRPARPLIIRLQADGFELRVQVSGEGNVQVES